ncbi:TetR/AcrR family transcriptional regulator [Micromonospora sp. NPDC049559]|uniref:TetR/AcrR family transcriptional regulator n=1 Tax=Micromonospora sp. NPDC049559 TaxID=3155923 RepID=UPI003424D7F8
MITAADAPRSPGRPRSVRADEAIVEATLDLISEGTSIEALSIEAIAGRAGVGKATIYRRWPGKDALVIDALRKLKGPPPVPRGESVRADLLTLLVTVGRTPDERAARVMPCLIPEINRSADRMRIWQEITAPRRQVMREVLQRGMVTGELRADLDVEVTIGLLTGPMLMHRMLGWEPEVAEQTLAERVVDTVLAGAAPA